MKWEIVDKTLSFKGFLRLVSYRLRHSLFAGGMGPVIERECLERGDAVAVLPYDARRDEVVLIEQFRIGALESAKGPWLMEIIAGVMELGETAEAVARREAVEEAGCTLGELHRIYHYYSSPGGSSERISLFVAQVDSAGIGGLHGLKDEGEDIRVQVMSTEEAFALLDSGVIDSAMPLLALQWLRLNREALRELWAD